MHQFTMPHLRTANILQLLGVCRIRPGAIPPFPHHEPYEAATRSVRAQHQRVVPLSVSALRFPLCTEGSSHRRRLIKRKNH